MKILLVGYFEDYARFFMDVGRALSAGTARAEVVHLCLAPSGCLHASLGGVTVLTPLAEKLKSLPRGAAGELDLDLKFYERGCRARSTDKLRALAARYQKWLDAHLQMPLDLAVLPGEYRLFEQLVWRHLRKRGVPVVFFEQGPERTTVLDPQGVNANCSFTTATPVRASHQGRAAARVAPALPVASWRKALYRLVDIAFYSLVALRHGDALDDEEFRRSILGKMRAKFGGGQPADTRSPDSRPFVLLALQVESDVNYSHHLATRWTYASMLRWLIGVNAGSRAIVVREHPLYRNRYGRELYEQLTAGSQVSIDNTTVLEKQLAQCVYVATANSTLGFEALLAGKPVLLFGSAYYQNCHGVLRANELDDGTTFESRLARLLAEPTRISSAAREFLELNFIAGHFRHYDASQLEAIAERVGEFTQPDSRFAQAGA